MSHCSETATRTVFAYSLPLTNRKYSELCVLSENFTKLVSFFLDKIVKDNITSERRLHQLYYTRSKEVVPDDIISTRYRKVAMRVALSIWKSFKKRRKKNLVNKDKPEIQSIFIKLYHENYNESASSFRLIKSPSKDRFYLIVKIAKGKQISIPIEYTPVLDIMYSAYKSGVLKLGEVVIKFDEESKIVKLYIPFRKSVTFREKHRIMTIDANSRYLVLSIFDKQTKELLYSKYLDLKRLEIIDNTYTHIAKELESKLYSGKNPKYLPEYVRKILKKRLRRWKIRKEDLIHKLAKYIIDIAVTFNAEIVMESIKNIKLNVKDKIRSKKIKRKVMLANLRKIQSIVEYKAKWTGIPVEYTDPSNTSKVCPICGSKLRPVMMGVSLNGRYLKCPKCGIIWERDFVATLNLAKQKMGGVGVPLDSPMMFVSKGAVLPNEIRSEGKICSMTVTNNYSDEFVTREKRFKLYQIL